MLEDGDFVPEQPSTAVYVIAPGNNGSVTKQFLAIIQQSSNGFHAEVPKLEKCAAEGSTPGEAEQRIYEAIQYQVQVMQRSQKPIPDNTLSAMYMAIPASVREKVAALPFRNLPILRNIQYFLNSYHPIASDSANPSQPSFQPSSDM